MNPLLQLTQTDIIGRQTFAKDSFADKHILAAVQSYAMQGSQKRRGFDFITALSGLWKGYKKDRYIDIFRTFVKLELGLQQLASEHVAHVNHVIQEFLFGYNILLNCNYYLRKFDYENGHNDLFSEFGKIFFSWMAAALFHDIGYDIEKAHEEECVRRDKNQFWDFMTSRPTISNSITISDAGNADELLERYILKEIEKIPSVPKMSYLQFKKLFKKKIQNTGWVRYDHGVISALKYLHVLQELEAQHSGTTYLDWEPNKRAAMAMAVHNLRYSKMNLCLSSTDPHTLPAYLLIVCDEIQEWERERDDYDIGLPMSLREGYKLKKRTELVGVSFKSRYTYVIIDHRLKFSRLRDFFRLYLVERIIIQKKNYPIQVKWPIGKEKIQDEMMRKIFTKFAVRLTIPDTARSNISLLDITEETYSTLKPYITRKKNLAKKVDKLIQTKTLKKVLKPSKKPIYKVFLEHRVDGDPFLVTMFPL